MLNSFITLLSLLFCLSSPLWSMEVESPEQQSSASKDKSFVLEMHEKAYPLSLRTVLSHISTYQYIKDVATEKISGFHWYGAYKPEIISLAYGTLCKITPFLWVVTSGDITKFHKGSLIYKGKVLEGVKTFFPSQWKQKDICSYVQHMATKGSVTIKKKEQEGTQKKYGVMLTAQDKVPLYLILQECPSLDKENMHLLTLHPLLSEKQICLPAHLQDLAKQQIAALEKLKVEVKAEPELLHALTQKDYTRAVKLLEQGADPNTSGDTEKTALMLAASHGAWQMVSTLLEWGAQKDRKDSFGNTALHYGVASASSLCVLGLLDHELVNSTNKEGITPLIRAIYEIKVAESKEQVQELIIVIGWLLKFGASVNAQDAYGVTPLMLACKCNRQTDFIIQGIRAVLELLVEYKPDCDMQDSEGNTALIHAVLYNQLSLFKYLLPFCAYMISNKKEETALSLAQKRDASSIRDSIIAFDHQKKEWIKEHGGTELMYAVFHRIMPTVRRLIQAHVDVNLKDTYGCTALLYAIQNNDYEIVKELMKAGAKAGEYKTVNCDARIKELLRQNLNNSQEESEKKENETVVNQELLKKQILADELNEEGKLLFQRYKESKNGDGVTPFIYAVQEGKCAVVRQMLELAPSITFQRDNQRQDCLLIALQKRYFALARMIIEGYYSNEQALETCFKQCLEAVFKKKENEYRQMLQLIVDVYPSLLQKIFQHIFGTPYEDYLQKALAERAFILSEFQLGSLLMLAIASKSNVFIQNIIESYPHYVHYKDPENKTLLMVAAQEGNQRVIGLLYEKGADLDVQDKSGKTALDYALQCPQTLEFLQNISLNKRLNALKKESETEKQKFEQRLKGIKDQEIANELIVEDWNDLLVAAYDNDVQTIKKERSKINQARGHGITALMVAAYKNNLEACETLLACPGIGINNQDKEGHTALIYAAKQGHLRIVQLLIKAGAWGLILDSNKQVPLKLVHSLAVSSMMKELLADKLVEESTMIALAVPETNTINYSKMRPLLELLSLEDQGYFIVKLAERIFDKYAQRQLCVDCGKVHRDKWGDLFLMELISAAGSRALRVMDNLKKWHVDACIFQDKQSRALFPEALVLGIKKWLRVKGKELRDASKDQDVRDIINKLIFKVNFHKLPQEYKSHLLKSIAEDEENDSPRTALCKQLLQEKCINSDFSYKEYIIKIEIPSMIKMALFAVFVFCTYKVLCKALTVNSGYYPV